MDDKIKSSPKKVCLPSGYVIPNGAPGEVHGLKFRVSEQKQNWPKYYNLPGSNTAPYILESTPIIFILESELDAWLLFQEAGDLVSCVAMGSARNIPTIETAEIFKNALVLFIALDSDSAGAQGSKWWLANFNQAVRWPVPVGNDPTEARQQGLNIRAWVQAAISSTGSNRAALEFAIEKFRQAATDQKIKPAQPADVPEPCRGCYAQVETNCIKNIALVPCAEAVGMCEYSQCG